MSKRTIMEDVYPLSPAQEGMLFHAISDQGSGVYVGQFGARLATGLDVDVFERAWRGVVERHPVLRTGFVWEKVDAPLQVVRREAALPFRHEDWRGVDEEEQARRIAEYLRADREAGFDLAQPPLMRLALFRLGDAAHQLVWTHHHLVLDGWSLANVYREVLALYEAGLEGRQARLGHPRPYRDYIAWIKRQDLAGAERFWRGELAGFSTPTPLGIGRAAVGDAEARMEAGRCSARLSPPATAALHALARRGQVTANTAAQGAWALLLARYSGEEDVLFGTSVSGRPPELEGMEEMVGMFVGTLPVRVRVPPDAPVLAWLERLHRRQVETREYEFSPLVQVQRWSEVPRGRPLFESFLSFQNYPVDPTARDRFGVKDMWGLESDDYPLSVTVSPSGEEMLLDCTFHDARFRPDEVGRVLEHFRNLLESLAAGPD
ncbi:MAG TPA: condensation domain-containing protein, partial [Longimicrobiaceae bacterium]|nr:condensation domain-containing protein [Longimicrobiaceae bacterium]